MRSRCCCPGLTNGALLNWLTISDNWGCHPISLTSLHGVPPPNCASSAFCPATHTTFSPGYFISSSKMHCKPQSTSYGKQSGINGTIMRSARSFDGIRSIFALWELLYAKWKTGLLTANYDRGRAGLRYGSNAPFSALSRGWCGTPHADPPLWWSST